MLLSRLWYIVLAACAAVAACAVVLAQTTLNRHFDKALGEQLRRDRFEMELWLKLK